MEPELHPVLAAAARGELPPWARMTSPRRAHVERVAALLAGWARVAGLDETDGARWRALGLLHDALRDEDPSVMRGLVTGGLAELPDPILHGPAAAARLRLDGVTDEPFLLAVTYHTLGHPGMDRIGRALFAADFLEPGRAKDDDWRAGLRARMPQGFDEVVREILQARIAYLVAKGRPVRPETLAFWNEIAEGEAWARASEV